MKRFVLDTSVALAWFLDHPIPPFAKEVAELLSSGSQAVVPALWHLEMANGLAVAERRQLVTADDVKQSLNYLEDLQAVAIETSGYPVSLRQALTSARALHLSAYDAAYLETARHERIPLATLDKSLSVAATRAKVELLS